jgi:hypothetical protein
MLIALSTGFTVVLLCGAGMYLIGAVLIGKMPDRTADDL